MDVHAYYIINYWVLIFTGFHLKGRWQALLQADRSSYIHTLYCCKWWTLYLLLQKLTSEPVVLCQRCSS